MSLKDLAESCSMLGGACGSILGWHEKPALAVGKVKAMGVTHSQSHNLGICMWRVRLSQQESNPSTVWGSLEKHYGWGSVRRYTVTGLEMQEGFSPLLFEFVAVLCSSELSFRHVLSWPKLAPGWRWSGEMTSASAFIPQLGPHLVHVLVWLGISATQIYCRDLQIYSSETMWLDQKSGSLSPCSLHMGSSHGTSLSIPLWLTVTPAVGILESVSDSHYNRQLFSLHFHL